MDNKNSMALAAQKGLLAYGRCFSGTTINDSELRKNVGVEGLKVDKKEGTVGMEGILV